MSIYTGTVVEYRLGITSKLVHNTNDKLFLQGGLEYADLEIMIEQTAIVNICPLPDLVCTQTFADFSLLPLKSDTIYCCSNTEFLIAGPRCSAVLAGSCISINTLNSFQ